MTVLWFDGFDIHALAEEGVVSIGRADYQGYPNWSHGTLGGTLNFDEGFDQGQAIRIPRNVPMSTDPVTLPRQARLHWYARRDLIDGVLTEDYRWFAWQVGGAGDLIGIRAFGGNNLQIAVFSSSLDFDGTPVGSGSGDLSTDWAHYEFFIDLDADHVELWQDGVLVAVADNELPATTALSDISFRRIGSSTSSNNVSTLIDHVVMTDGTRLTGSSTRWHSVGVVRAVARGGGDSEGSIQATSRGRLVIDGEQYLDTTTHPSISADIGPLNSTSPSGTNVYYGYFHENPHTSEPWTNDIFNEIQEWGICRTDSGGGRLYVASGALTAVEIVNGFPQVRIFGPSGPTKISGDWIRTNNDKSWFGHLTNYPRIMPIWEDSDTQDHQDPFDNPVGWLGQYIATETPGCLTFQASSVPPPFLGIGLTFAEEFRTTYRDWETLSAADYDSYFVTGYKVHGEGDKKFQSNYVTVNYGTHLEGGAFLQGVWNYAITGDSGKWGTTQQVYGPGNNPDLYKHAARKLKVRGTGRALQFKVKSQLQRPFFINGWTVFVTGNSTT